MTEAKAMIASLNEIIAKDRRRLTFTQNKAKMRDWEQIAGPLSLLLKNFNLKRQTKSQAPFSF
jgi:hypothetical protein